MNKNYENNDFEGFTDDICNTRQLLEKMYSAFDRNVKGPTNTDNILKLLVMMELLKAINSLRNIERMWEI